MEPERVRAYLQVACAGLGFDIGEVWWTSDENGSSSMAAIGKQTGRQAPFRGLKVFWPDSHTKLGSFG
jgi:hypothetical protein